MKIEVPVESLMRQLPRSIQVCLITSDVLPSKFVFEGTLVTEESDNSTRTKYQRAYSMMSPTQWFMFCEMVKSPDGVSITMLGLNAKTRSRIALANLVASHVAAIRRKLKQSKTRMTLRAVRGIGETRYRLVEY